MDIWTATNKAQNWDKWGQFNNFPAQPARKLTKSGRNRDIFYRFPTQTSLDSFYWPVHKFWNKWVLLIIVDDSKSIHQIVLLLLQIQNQFGHDLLRLLSHEDSQNPGYFVWAWSWFSPFIMWSSNRRLHTQKHKVIETDGLGWILLFRYWTLSPSEPSMTTSIYSSLQVYK